jgi:hypothetical protein
MWQSFHKYEKGWTMSRQEGEGTATEIEYSQLVCSPLDAVSYTAAAAAAAAYVSHWWRGPLTNTAEVAEHLLDRCPCP